MPIRPTTATTFTRPTFPQKAGVMAYSILAMQGSCQLCREFPAESYDAERHRDRMRLAGPVSSLAGVIISQAADRWDIEAPRG